MNHRATLTTSVLAFALLVPATAWAHVSIASGPAFADVTQEVTFGVGHGCEGADTYAVSVEIPTGVTSVRPETSDFGQVDVETDSAGSIVMVSWTKPDTDVLESDSQYYKLVVRLKPPNEPFTSLFFPSRQTCRAADGTETVVDWVGIDVEEGGEVEPAPELLLVPARFPGWNRFTVGAALPELGAFFGDAEIVWRGNAAYSINPTTVDLIGSTDGVTLLESLDADDEIWVKY
jgi:uncharacterized protein YcnI